MSGYSKDASSCAILVSWILFYISRCVIEHGEPWLLRSGPSSFRPPAKPPDLPFPFEASAAAMAIIDHREITEEEYLKLFDQENDYLAAWDDEQKKQFINVIENLWCPVDKIKLLSLYHTFNLTLKHSNFRMISGLN